MASGAMKKLVRKVLSDRVKASVDQNSAKKMVLDIEKWPQEWHDRIKDAKVVAAYMPIKDELLLDAWILSLRLQKKTICLPRVEDDDIVFYAVTDEKDLQVGSYGIREPKEGLAAVQKECIDIMLIPASAYGMDGKRLGRGKGYYDRYLDGNKSSRNCRAYLIGVVPESNLLKKVPFEEWDVSVDAIVTDKRFIEV